jgi:RNA polymerase sigma-70 factor, ECF subfamily
MSYGKRFLFYDPNTTIICNNMAKKTLHTSEMADPGDEFEAMYESNAPLIYRFMFWRTKDKMLAEDLTSSVFEKAWRSRDSFKGGSAKAWLHKIARNTLIDHWRKRQELLVDDPAALETEDKAPALAEALDQAIAIEDLQRALAKLPGTMRQVVEFRFIDGLSAKQTAQIMELTEANIRVIQYRALRKLRGYLE